MLLRVSWILIVSFFLPFFYIYYRTINSPSYIQARKRHERDVYDSPESLFSSWIFCFLYKKKKFQTSLFKKKKKIEFDHEKWKNSTILPRFCFNLCSFQFILYSLKKKSTNFLLNKKNVPSFSQFFHSPWHFYLFTFLLCYHYVPWRSYESSASVHISRFPLFSSSSSPFL